jgi:SAM-dependent methyltransferase
MTVALHSDGWKVRQTAAKRKRLAVWLTGDGIEIGALHRPLAVPATAQVRYVDRMTEPDLRQHYPELAGQTFAPVSIIGSAYDLTQVADGALDFVVANHLVEHLDYPIKGFREFARVLRPGGILYMALPDARVGIDQDRALTSLDHLMEEHRHGANGSRRTHYLEWVTQSEKQMDDPEKRAQRLMDMDYSIHFHCWRPDTFLDFFFAAKREVDLPLNVVAFAPPEFAGDDEFILVLVKGSGDRVPLPPGAERPTLRRRIGQSPIGPLLRPLYRRAKQTATRWRARRFGTR